ncbi:MAG: hypothetical protein ISP74_03805 [Bacteroidia bacterium]|nr:hypothetical protein [Bacteroidia bacterium]
MKNLIKVLSLTAMLSITVIACNEKKECKEGSKKECCEKKEASTNDSEKDKPCYKKKKKLVAQNMTNPVVIKRNKSVNPIVTNHVAQQKQTQKKLIQTILF